VFDSTFEERNTTKNKNVIIYYKTKKKRKGYSTLEDVLETLILQ